MLSVSQFSKYRKNEITYITGTESLPCSVCGECRYTVRNTCIRYVKDEMEQLHKFRIRVLRCKNCGRTHRELPQGIVPYKRYSLEAICHMADGECITEPSIRLRILSWLTWFLWYARNVLESMKLQSMKLTEPDGWSLPEKLVYFVRLTANSGFWSQHRSAVTAS